PRNDLIRIFTTQHDNYALNQIILILKAHLPQSRLGGNFDFCYMLDQNRSIVAYFNQDIFNVLRFLQQAHTTHYISLGTPFDYISAYVDIALGYGFIHVQW